LDSAGGEGGGGVDVDVGGGSEASDNSPPSLTHTELADIFFSATAAESVGQEFVAFQVCARVSLPLKTTGFFF
jgi:hypothetical protein